jgi:hypothetical protein
MLQKGLPAFLRSMFTTPRPSPHPISFYAFNLLISGIVWVLINLLDLNIRLAENTLIGRQLNAHIFSCPVY